MPAAPTGQRVTLLIKINYPSPADAHLERNRSGTEYGEHGKR